jgi:hypothetical protein
MASVRASIVNQARVAASAPTAAGDATDCPAIDRLLRCAKLSGDPARTLEWAFDTLRAHSSSRADQLACQLLQAARARLDAQPEAQMNRESAPTRSFAWI